MTDESEAAAAPQGHAKRPAIMLLNGPMAGRVFEIPEEQQRIDGSPRDFYWFPVTMSFRLRSTGKIEDVEVLLKYEFGEGELGTGYYHTDSEDPNDLLDDKTFEALNPIAAALMKDRSH